MESAAIVPGENSSIILLLEDSGVALDSSPQEEQRPTIKEVKVLIKTMPQGISDWRTGLSELRG